MDDFFKATGICLFDSMLRARNGVGAQVADYIDIDDSVLREIFGLEREDVVAFKEFCVGWIARQGMKSEM
jgi:hypothetical protein